MKIAEYLKSSPIFALLAAEQVVSQELQRVLRQEGVNVLEALTLITILLESHRPISPGELARTFACSKARLSQVLASLEAQGWLHRSLACDDARSHSLTLSGGGLSKANRLMRCMEGLEASIEAGMDASARQGLTALLTQLHASLRPERREA